MSQHGNNSMQQQHNFETSAPAIFHSQQKDAIAELPLIISFENPSRITCQDRRSTITSAPLIPQNIRDADLESRESVVEETPRYQTTWFDDPQIFKSVVGFTRNVPLGLACIQRGCRYFFAMHLRIVDTAHIALVALEKIV